jgi:uncharacterized lipoprotein YmbA
MESTAQTTATPSTAGDSRRAPQQRLEVRRILVPDYLDSTDILLRSDGDEVKASVTGRWGERLSLGLTDAVGADLAARMPQYLIVRDAVSKPQQQLLITITALDLWPSGRCVLAATWSIVDQDDSMPASFGSGTFASQNAGDPTTALDAGLVESVARTLGKLADRVVHDVQTRPERTDLRGGSKIATAD